MKKLLLGTLVVTLAACNATQGPSTAKSESGGVMGGIGALAGAAASGGSGSTSTDMKVSAGMDAYKAATVSDADLKNISLQMRARDDKKSMAPASDKYAQRLAKLTARHVNEDGLTLNFAVYRSDSINANATADGSIRVYSGLMDKMTDQELLGIIGHEIGHVKKGHSMASMRTAYMASAGRKLAASASGVTGALADSDLGAIGEKLVKSQFSQSQETESDDYGLAFMKKYGYDAKAMESAFRKLAALGGAQSGLDQMMSSHPDSAKRADRMRDKLASK